MEKSASKNFVYNSLYQIAAIIIPIITTPYLTRVLGAGGIGQYGFELSIASYFMLCIKLGLNNYGNRKIAAIREDKRVLSQNFWSIYLLQLFTSVIFIALYVLYALVISNDTIISIILIMYVVSAGLDITWFYWGLEEFKLTVLRDFAIKILTTISIFLFVKNADDVWVYTLIMSMGAFLSQVFLWIGINRRISIYKPGLKEILFHLKPNLVLFIPVIAVSLYNTMDKIMLGLMSNKVEVGFYESSEKIVKIPVALVTSLGTVMLPRMSNIYANSKDETAANSIIDKSIVFALFLATSLGFGIMTISKQFVPFFYGKGFEKCILLFDILLPSCVFMSFANVIRTQYLIPKQMDKVYLISVFVGAGTNLVFNYIFIPVLQSAGAAIGTFIAEASVCIVQYIAVYKKIDLRKSIKKCVPFLASGILMFLIFNDLAFQQYNNVIELAIKIALAGGTYILLLLISIFIINFFKPNTYDFTFIKKFKLLK